MAALRALPRAGALPRLQEPRPEVADTLGVDSRAGAVGFAESAGRRIELITIAPFGTIQIAHKLARTPIGWRVIDATDGPAILYRVSWDDKFLVLTHAGVAPTTPTLWVF